MDNIATLKESEREDLIRATAAKKGFNEAVVEKDFWVCWTLAKLFTADCFAGKLLFKGGTSLSKVFKVIERFSEDIDLVLHQSQVTTEDLMDNRSRKKQEEFTDGLIENTRLYLRDEFLPHLQAQIEPTCQSRIDDRNENIIHIRYPEAFSETYLRSEISLEIGPRSGWTPNDVYEIAPYAAEEFPQLFSTPSCRVTAVKAERTFWEKATILHHEANRPEESICPTRLSRHYYDVKMMCATDIKNSALSDLGLLREVVDFKKKYFPRGWAKYDEARPGSFKLTPPPHVRRAMEKDYREMRVMIFGRVPPFEEILDTIAGLQNEINSLR